MYITVDYVALAQQLQTQQKTVLFRKLDGTLREMQCTLAANVVPATKGVARKQNDTVFTVYDVVAQDWRCFKKDRVIAIY